MWSTLRDAARAALHEPLAVVTTPDERAYWGFLLVSLVIGAAALWWRTGSPVASVHALLSPRLWLHPSARMDYRLIVLKAFVNVLLLAIFAVSAYGVAVAVFRGATSWWGPAGPTTWSRLQITAVYTVVLFVAWDGSRYLVHMLLHRIPLLWEFHKVHHSAEVLTPFTVYRVHPVESLLFAVRGALVTGVVTGAFFYAFGDRAVQYELLGVNAIGVILNAAGANLRHSHVWLSYGRVVEGFLISPAQHQLHHSLDPADADCNYGSFLAVWDRLGGTLVAAGKQPRRFGLPADELNHDPHRATSAILGPFVAVARRIARRLTPREERHHETEPV